MRMGMARWIRLWPVYRQLTAALLAQTTVPAWALLAGSAWKRFGTFEAGVASTKDPKYVVVPQREGLEAADGERHPPT